MVGVACALATTQLRNPQSIDRDAPEKYPKDKNNKQRRKSNTIFNEASQFAYVLGARERDPIDSIINTSFSRGYNS